MSTYKVLKFHTPTAVPPEITGQPQSLESVPPKTSITFTVTATGNLPVQYTWEWTEQR